MIPLTILMITSELLSNLPPEFSKDLVPEIHNLLTESKKTIVVLDDSPTGTQSVFDVPVITDLDPTTIRDAIDEAPPILFLLTNSHTLTAEQTSTLHQTLGDLLKEFQEDIIVISRSDSPLTGHFPLETDTLHHALGIAEAPTLIIPFCATQQHLTIDNTTYQIEDEGEGETATPLNHPPLDTPESLSLADLRSGDITAKLAALPPSSNCLVNAASLADLNVLTLALLKSNRRFVIRAGSSFTQSLAGIVSRPSLTPWQMQDLEPNPNGGLIIIGSHSPQTADQLNHLLKNAPDITPIKLSAPDILNDTFNLERATLDTQTAITSGKTAVLFTSRDQSDEKEPSPINAKTKTISQALSNLVRAIDARPSFIIAKGRTTSTDLATHALGVKQAMALGQILPGVPVWTIGNQTLHPGLAYIIFPGSTGPTDALTQAHQKLTS